MTQQSTNKAYHTFVKGIITEAGPLTFPENASLDEENCVLNRDGSRQRRLGMDFEDDFVLRDVTIQADDAVASFIWENAANDVNNQFAVVQAGNRLLIFDASEVSLSANLIANLNMAAYINPNIAISCDSGLGYLWCASGAVSPFYLRYDPSSGTITATGLQLVIRDQFGVEDGIAVTDQPAALTDAHEYNLLNQGWPSAHITTYKTDTGVYPSNVQQWFVGKDSNEDFQSAQLGKMDFGSTPAPKGRYIIDAFNRSPSRELMSGTTGLPSDIETGRPSVVAFAYERIWYSGVQSSINSASETRPNMTGFVFYSRTLRSAKDATQCHPDADPTSEIDSELVDTDGGFVNIPNSGPIYKLLQKGTSMLVFAEKGVWAIEGDEGGFRATSNQVNKLSNFGVLGAFSIVDIEDSVIYWNKGGIYRLAPDESTGRLSAKNISEDTIQTLYNNIPKAGKTYAIGTFDPINRRVMWMYNDEDSYTGMTFRNKYNKELVLDLVLGAFYKHSISTYLDPSPYIAGYVPTPDFLLRQEGVRSRGDTITKYMTVQFVDPSTNSASVSFAYYRNAQFRDWKSLDGIGASFSAYLLTGYEIMGDSARNKQATYVTTHFQHTETEVDFNSEGVLDYVNPSGCFIQAQWEWANSPDSGKWSEVQQAYRPLIPMVLPDAPGPVTYGYKVITNKHRLPGSGKSLSILFTSDGDKDFYLYGWNIPFTGVSSA